MYGLFIYKRWKMATLKGKWLGKYSPHGAFGDGYINTDSKSLVSNLAILQL